MDPDGFDPIADTVGPGIYSGNIVRDRSGNPVMGKQYRNHNPTPGPVYAGTGYTEMAKAIHKGPEEVKELLRCGADPNEVMTGGSFLSFNSMNSKPYSFFKCRCNAFAYMRYEPSGTIINRAPDSGRGPHRSA